MKRLLVTGGAGFIGSNFVRYMLGKYPDYRIIVLDALTYAGNLDNFHDVKDNPNFQFFKGNIEDPVIVDNLSRNVDAVINFAAESIASDTFLPIHYGHGVRLATAEELFDIYAKKRGVHVNERGVEIVEPNLPLSALSFHNGMGQWKRITQITRHHYTGRIVSLRQKWGSVRVTPNHSVYNANATLVAAETNPELLAIRKINVDRSRHRDYLRLSFPDIHAKDGLLYAPTTDGRWRGRDVWVLQTLQGEALKAFLRFLGAYASEGSASFNTANGSYMVCIANKDLATLEQMRVEIAFFTNASGSITRREEPQVHQLVYSSRMLFEVATRLCGKGSHEKRVPDDLYTLREEYKEAFLESYLWGDGNTQKYETVHSRRMTTASPRLAAGLSLLFSLMDLDYSVSYRDFADNDLWEPVTNLYLTSSYDSRVSKDYSEADYNGYVYDLTVEDAHNFAAGIGNVVVHNTHVDRSIDNPGAFIETDVRGVFVLLEAAKKYGHERFLHVSTDEVYGSILEGSFIEGDPLEPNSPYSASKAGGELLVRAYHVTYGLPTIVTRGSNNFGPYHYPEKLIPLMITNAIDNLPLPVYGDGKQVRDWMYVLDHCAGIDIALHHGTSGEIYNVGGGNERFNVDVVNAILAHLGKGQELIRYVQDRPGHDRRYSIDCTKLRALGYDPQVSFEERLEETVRWYVENEAWWRKIKEKQDDYKTFAERWYADRK